MNNLTVGIVLDQTRSGSCSGDFGRYFPFDAIDAACQITGCPSARLIFEGSRRFHVNMHYVGYVSSPN